ncbi:MAG TPA: FtsX-like permease family protein [Thermoanaerobaculia bacterium]|nr:FtsX-like permease family protein [Thermoanaerobaculia bacterium]
MNLPLRIAWRYLKRPTDKLVSAVGLVSVLGLVIGVMALVISMALMTGYRDDLQEKLLAGNAEIFVYSIDGSIDRTPELATRIEAIPGVREASPVVFQQALITSEDHGTGEQVMLKGIDPSRAASSPMLERIVGDRRFSDPEGEPGVSMGVWLARKLAVAPGSAVTVTVPTENSGSVLPQSAAYVVTNVFETGFFEFDSRWIFMPLAEAHALLRTDGRSNLIEIGLDDPEQLDAVLPMVMAVAGESYAVTDWREMNRQLFSLLRIQQLVLFIVIGLIVFVSTFNIVSTLIMTVHEKRKEIGILISMGSERRLIRRIFVYYGVLVGLTGTAAGIFLGVLANWTITEYELISFGPEIAEVYFVSSIPFLTRWTDVAVIAAFAVAVSFLATLVPSARAARISPADAVRYE